MKTKKLMGMVAVGCVLIAILGVLGMGSGSNRAAPVGTSQSPELSKAVKAIKARQGRAESLHVSWSVALQELRKPADGPPIEEWVPVDRTSTQNHEMWIQGSTLRFELNRSSGKTSLVITPQEKRVRHVNTQQGENRVGGHVTSASAGYYGAQATSMLPITCAYRLVDPTIGLTPADSLTLLRETTYNGHPCLVVQGATNSVDPSSHYVLWLARDQDYVPLRCEYRAAGEVMDKVVDMEYTHREGVGWVLQSWKQIDMENGKKISVSTVDTVQAEFNTSIPADRFRLTVPEESR